MASEETDEELQLIFAPGCHLRGARAKASVIDPYGHVCVRTSVDVCLTGGIALHRYARWSTDSLTIPMLEMNVSRLCHKQALKVTLFERSRRGA
ncbi:hypothetical protein [Trinickia sp. EG282A]|uniref:hypothetical protein n=1 Tax=Trinickia sp. EG282A TaxID=3237013 RepID=UPI0034D1AC7B